MMESTIGFASFASGIVFIAVAVVMLVFPPRKINDFYGYRTSGSKQSQERWDFAQKFSAWRMLEAGFFLTFLSFIPGIFAVSPEIIEFIGIATLIASCLYMFLRTERAIKKKFPV